MSRLNELREQRSRKLQRMQAIDAGAVSASRDLTAEEQSEWSTLDAEVRAMDAPSGPIERAKRNAELQRSEPSNDNAEETRALGRFNVATAMLAQSQRMRGEAVTVDDGMEREVSTELRNRAGGVDPAFAGGLIIPMSALRREQRAISYGAGSGSGKGLTAEEYRPDQFIPELQAVSLAGSLGVQFLTDLVGAPVTLPKLTTGMQLQFVAEGSALTPSDPATDKVSLTPRIAGAVTSISPILLQQPQAQSIVSNHLLRVAAAGLDRVIFVGGGSNEPSGLWDTLTPATLGEPTWAEILGLIEGIENDNVGVSRLGWALNPSAKRKLRSTPKLSFGSPVTETVGDFIMDSANELAGYAAVSSTTIPTVGSPPSTAGILAGDFSEVVAGVWESASILLNPYSEADFLRGQIGVRVLMLCDVAVKREEAFRAATIAI
jgi:HK97 family phage major capsid protein